MVKRLKELHEAQLTAKTPADIQRINDELQYIYAKRNGTIPAYRSQVIASRVAKKYSLDKQIEILLNNNVDDIVTLKVYRVQVALDVDQMINSFESQLQM